MKKLLALGVLAVLLASLPVVASDKKNKLEQSEVKVEQTESVETVKPIEIRSKQVEKFPPKFYFEPYFQQTLLEEFLLVLQFPQN